MSVKTAADSGAAREGVIHREISYRRRLIDQWLGGPVHFRDQIAASQAEFRALHEGWLAPQCAVLDYHLEWLRRERGIHPEDLQPFLELGAFLGHLSGHLDTRLELRGVCSDLDASVTAKGVEQLLPRLGLRLERTALMSSDAQALPFRDHSFGFVFTFSALHHWEHPVRCLSEIARVLRPGGVFLCAWEPLQPLLRMDRVPRGRTEIAEGLIERVYTLSQFDRLIRGTLAECVSLPYDAVRVAPFRPKMFSGSLRSLCNALPRPLRRTIIRLAGGQDYSALGFKT